MLKMLALTILAAFPGLALGQANASDTIDVSPKGNAPDAPVGSYKQPVWSTHRTFPTTRAYVLPEGTLEAELWMKAHTYKNGEPNDYLFQQELEYGLGHRLQLDVYVNEVNEVRDEDKRMNDLEGYQLELRWALADWGALPLNPTFYFEYHPRKDAPEKGEVRLLLGDTLAPDWHYAVNLGYEVELWGEERERELVATAAVSTTKLSPVFAVGFEVKGEWVDVKDNRGHFHPETVAGPSFQWRPSHGTHLDLAPLFGVQDDAPKTETYLIFGTDL